MSASLGFELLPPESVPGFAPDSLAAAIVDGSLAPADFRLARALEDLGPPQEQLEPAVRKGLAARLERCLTTQRPHVAVLDAIRSLREPGACVVVTGQQPGLCASPLLSLYKALQALRLAASLRRAWQRPVLALFWNHADDHDVAEVHHTWLVNENLDLQRVALAGMASGRQPVGRISLEDERHNLPALRAVLEQALVRSGNDPARRARAQRAVEQFLPRAGETLATAFTRSMTALLGHLGLVLLEPEWIREEFARALATIVQHDPIRALQAGAQALRAAGHAPAIEPGEAALVYRLDERGRLALRPGGEGYRYDDEPGSRNATELAAEIVQDLRGWSPGALLRPLAQDLTLPVAAYVGGAGELAYHAQLGPLRRACGAPLTPFVLRRSCTLVEPEAAVALRKLEVDARVVLEGRLEQALGDDAGAAAPAAIESLRQAGERAAAELLAPREELARFDRALAQNLSRTAAQLRSMVDKLVAKGERVHQNSSGKGRRHVRRVENCLRPRGLPQERVLGPLPFVARFGGEWIDELLAQLDPFERRHLLATFAPEPTAAGQASSTEEDDA